MSLTGDYEPAPPALTRKQAELHFADTPATLVGEDGEFVDQIVLGWVADSD